MKGVRGSWASFVFASLVVGAIPFACSSPSVPQSAPDPNADATADSAGFFDSGNAIAGNLLSNGDFEEPATSGCGPDWVAVNGGTIALSTVSEDGHYSCMICGTLGTFGVSQSIPGTFTGTTLSVQAATGPAPQSTPIEIQLTVSWKDADGGLGSSVVPIMPQTGVWTPLADQIPVGNAPISNLVITFGNVASLPSQECFLVDNVGVVKQ